jgi:pimeloyl-ACP methyl ester carboxylesterase
MNTAEIQGITLEYEVVGNGEPVLLISPVLADGFLPLLSEPALANRYRLIRYHKRGWVGSTRGPGPVSIADHVADAAGLLEHLGVRRAHVVGHSSGGAVALQMGIDRPSTVQTLGLLEPSLLSVPAADAFFKEAQPAFDAFAAGRREDAIAAFMNVVSGLDWKDCRALLEKRMPGSVAQSVADADTFFGVELPGLTQWRFDAEQARKVGAPALLVVGARTKRLWVEVAERLRSWLAQVEECKVDDAGHLLHIQRPEPIARALADFFARHPMTR